jgi:hypothetical protein
MANLAYTAANIRPLGGALVRQFLAGATLAPGDLVYLASDGDVEKSDASDSATADAIGVVVPSNDETSFAAGKPVSVCIFGPVAGFSSLTPGARGYVSDDAGKLEDAAGTFVKCMGYAEAADIFVFLPGMAALTSS